MGHPTRPTQPSILPWVMIHVITWITRVATISRRSGPVGVGLAYGLQAVCPLCLWHKQRIRDCFRTIRYTNSLNYLFTYYCRRGRCRLANVLWHQQAYDKNSCTEYRRRTWNAPPAVWIWTKANWADTIGRPSSVHCRVTLPLLSSVWTLSRPRTPPCMK